MNKIKYTWVTNSIILALPTYKIIGGTTADVNQFPYQVSVQFQFQSQQKHICSGSILSAEWIITAAHCITEVPSFGFKVVEAGTEDLSDIFKQNVKVQKEIVHPLYKGY